jgi:hypothetical protein
MIREVMTEGRMMHFSESLKQAVIHLQAGNVEIGLTQSYDALLPDCQLGQM